VLVDLIALALDENPGIEAAESRSRGARAERSSAALDLVPTVTAITGYSRQRFANATLPGASGAPVEQDLWDAGVQLSWELDLFGRSRRTLQGRGALVASAEEDARQTRVEVAAAVASAYFDLRGVQERLAFALSNAENQRNTLQLTEDRLEAGRGTALDTERARAQLSSTLAALPELEARISASRYRIARLLGVPAEELTAELVAPGELPALPEFDSRTATRDVVLGRPDVLAADRRRAASAAFAQAARADYLPRVSIAGSAGYTSSALDALGANGTPRYAIGPMVSWPLLDLGRVRAGVDLARAGRMEAEATYEDAVLAAVEEVETTLVAYRRSRERLAHLDAAASASERAADLARLRFDEGGSGYLEVLDAERTRLETQDRLAIGRAQAAAAFVAAYRAAGGSITTVPE
ncbi:MAG TPA: TolC family protein, partial [Longimicrobiaceae bacterium]|nr:TolC family protein [Longimicrobiaceae bacterium]